MAQMRAECSERIEEDLIEAFEPFFYIGGGN
jgi:hypothetical protein